MLVSSKDARLAGRIVQEPFEEGVAMILCHKCSGLLTDGPTPLYKCGCISGYIRGHESALTVDQALTEQIKATKADLALYRGQGRDEQGSHIQGKLVLLANLESAI